MSLLNAVRGQNLSEIKECIANFKHVPEVFTQAIKDGNKEVIELLIDNGFTFSAENVAQSAAYNNVRTEIFSTLLKHLPKAKFTDTFKVRWDRGLYTYDEWHYSGVILKDFTIDQYIARYSPIRFLKILLGYDFDCNIFNWTEDPEKFALVLKAGKKNLSSEAVFDVIEKGNAKSLSVFFEHAKYQLESFTFCEDKEKYNLADFAAKNCKLDCLKVCVENGFKCTTKTAVLCLHNTMYLSWGEKSNTFERGSFEEIIEILTFVLNQGVELSAEVSAQAASYFKVLKHLLDLGCPYDSRLCANAAKSENLEVLKYAHKTLKCEWDEKTCENAAMVGSLKCLRYAHENGCKWDSNTIKYCFELGSKKFLKYVIPKGCPIDWECIIEPEFDDRWFKHFKMVLVYLFKTNGYTEVSQIKNIPEFKKLVEKLRNTYKSTKCFDLLENIQTLFPLDDNNCLELDSESESDCYSDCESESE